MNILILGGSSDVGLSLATYLKKLGNNVLVTYNTHKPSINNIDIMPCNVKNKEEINNVIASMISKYGMVDVLINMFATYHDDEFKNLTKEKFMDACEVNIVGSFLSSQIYSEYMQDGTIINIASTDGIDTYNEYNLIYSATKAALINMSKSMCLGTSNRVLCLCPNWLDSATTRSIDKTFLASELKRINQSRLITLDEFNESINKLINEKLPTGSIIRLDVKGDQLCLKKIS